jgi:putative transposase
MNVQKITADYRLSQWAKVIQAKHESGLTVKEFCLTAGINKNAYYYWQRKLREAACEELSIAEKTKDVVPSGWIELNREQQQPTSDKLDIEINGCQITVNAQTDTELLKKVCCILLSL